MADNYTRRDLFGTDLFGWLYLLIDDFDTPAARTSFYHRDVGIHHDDSVRFVHVMSHARHGEVRVYVIWDGRLWLGSPCYSGRWPEVDEAVSAALGMPVVPYVMPEHGGVVTFSEVAS